MLQQIRKSLTSTIVFILLALLIASFAFFGVGGIVSQQGTIVATVGNQEITMVEVRDAFDGEMQRLREQFGPTITTEQALQFGLHRQVLSQLILNAALNEEAENLELLGSDEEVRQMIRQMEFFHDLRGNFSEVTYQQVLLARGWTAQEFEDMVRIDIARQQLIEGITDTALVPNIMKKTLYSYRKESRKAEIATIPATALSDVPNPTEEDLLAYYESRSASFMSPEYRDLSFFILDPEDFAAGGDFSEEELRAEYERRFDEFNIPPRRAFRVAILRTREQAEELIERVSAGEDFAAVSSELTGVGEDDLLGGPSSYSELSTNYSERAAEAVFSTEVGTITEPLETLVSWQVFQVTEEIPGTSRSFEEVRENLRQTLAEERGIDALYDAVGVVDDEIAAGATLEEVSEAVGKPAIHIPAVSINGQTPEGKIIEQTEVFPFLQEAFQRHPDDPLEFPQTEEGERFYMIRVNEIIEPSERPFEEVREQVRRLWVQEQSLQIIAERAREALASAQQGESLQSIAERHGGVRFETDTYVRDRVFTQQELSPEIASLMFSLDLGEVGIEQDAQGNGYVLVRVSAINEPRLDPSNPEYQALEARLSVEMKNDLFAQFQAGLREEFDIEINEQLLEGIFDPDFQQPGPGIFSPQ